MPHLLSLTQGSFTSIDLGSNAFWRISIGAGEVDRTPALSLNFTYPPGVQFRPIDGAGIPTIASLAKVPITLAQTTEEASRVAHVALAGGSLESDRARLREAFEMFKNNPRSPRQESIDQAVNDATQLIDLYWQIVNWVREGAKNKWSSEVLHTTIEGVP